MTHWTVKKHLTFMTLGSELLNLEANGTDVLGQGFSTSCTCSFASSTSGFTAVHHAAPHQLAVGGLRAS